ncbi:hypothetical protein [Paenibacillus sp. J22TS3]|uniref:hypothetical protein n=1 Tax=Paenibacillus sp. J22TS3 TaxID=2807192 RepID=UPI001B1B2483|nr:hypothetical protein [Paenibacillus sp. J22TS3]GIP21048.1 hypothetical protein J22TS3_13230 [Paenibacillus sp. J22TS3]
MVWNFLSKELNNKSENYKFMRMGPSPFYVNFKITNKFTEPYEEDFTVKLLKQERRGRHNYTFVLNTDDELEYEEIQRDIYLSTARELGFYYELQQIDNRRNYSWTKIEIMVDMLLESQSLSFWKFKGRFLQSRALLNELFHAISKFERDEIVFKQRYNNDIKEVYTDGEFSFFRKNIEELYAEFMEFPTEQVLRYINTFEQRRLNLNGASSAIIGGSIGALLTILFAK